MKKRQSDGEVVKRLLKTADGVALFLMGVFVTSNTVTNFNPATPGLIGVSVLTLAFLALFTVRGFGQYEPRQLGDSVKATAYTFSIFALLGYGFFVVSGSLGLTMNTNWIKVWLLLVGSHTFITRFAILKWTKPNPNQNDFRKRIAIVGGGKAAEDAIVTLEKSANLDIEIIGLFDDRFDTRSPESVLKHKKLGKISALANYARDHQVDLIVVAIPMSAEQRLLQILKRLWELPVDIRVSGQAAKLKLSPKAYTYLGDLPLLAIFDRPLSSWNQFTKDVVDRVIALVAIIMLAPVMAVVAIMVKLESKGPAIFKQRRFGYNNELIEVFKFRSMYTDKTDAVAAKLVTKNDPRVTKVGRFIRKTSLDELPQLFNVLSGQLSLVGPRPHATQAKAAGTLYDEVVEGYFARHKVKPGITGWAQINGWRGES